MANLSFTDEEISNLVTEIKNQLIPVLLEELKNKNLPPILTRVEFMELVGISASKCNELFNRQDFPVTRELGHPRVVTKDFFEWLSNSTNAAEVQMNYPYQIV